MRIQYLVYCANSSFSYKFTIKNESNRLDGGHDGKHSRFENAKIRSCKYL